MGDKNVGLELELEDMRVCEDSLFFFNVSCGFLGSVLGVGSYDKEMNWWKKVVGEDLGDFFGNRGRK